MPTKYYHRQNILSNILKSLHMHNNDEGITIDSDNPRLDQRQYSKMLKRREDENVIVRRIGNKLLFWKR